MRLLVIEASLWRDEQGKRRRIMGEWGSPPDKDKGGRGGRGEKVRRELGFLDR